jgi:hypothetical protein
VSKSSFLLLIILPVAFLASAASLHSGGAWRGEIRSNLRYEARAGFDALEAEAQGLRVQAESAPNRFRALWNDVTTEIGILKADVSIDARMAAKRLSTL